MKTIELFDEIDNLKCGIFQDDKGLFLAMSFTQSKNFKTEKAARKWIVKFL
jgi:hypothetical protein